VALGELFNYLYGQNKPDEPLPAVKVHVWFRLGSIVYDFKLQVLFHISHHYCDLLDAESLLWMLFQAITLLLGKTVIWFTMSFLIWIPWVENVKCVPLRVFVSHFVYPFLCQWTIEMLPLLSIVNMKCCLLPWTCRYKYLFESLILILWGYVPQSAIAESHGNSMFNLFLGTFTLFSKCLLYFIVPPTAHKCFTFSMSSITLVIFLCF
jgi:hypothetical protein